MSAVLVSSMRFEGTDEDVKRLAMVDIPDGNRKSEKHAA